jgi:hypothetical protein
MGKRRITGSDGLKEKITNNKSYIHAKALLTWLFD